MSRPGDLSQPGRRAAAADTGSVLSRGEQRLVSKGAFAAVASQPKDSVVQEQPGFGHFNQARFLALQAGPLVTTSSGDADERSSPPEEPAQPAYKVTAANAEPVGPRGKTRSETLGEPGSTLQAVDQLLDEIQLSQPVFAGQKRKAFDGDQSATAVTKKQLTTVATHASYNATYPAATGSQAVPGVVDQTPAFQTQLAMNRRNALKFGQPTCTHCFEHQVPNCDGRAHCNQGSSHKCYYVLCDPATCLGAACVKMHSSQYDIQARKKSQTRRLVIGDPKSLPAGQWDKHAHGKTVVAMGRATSVNQQPFAGLPAPNQGIYQIPQGHVQGSSRQKKNPALMSEPAHSGPMFNARGIKLEPSDN